MMFEGKHIHFSPVDKKPLCSYSVKLCKQRRINGYAFCIRHILEDKSAPFKQCAHVARYNKQKCTNPIPSNENREFCNSHMQVAGMLPKKERKSKKEKDKELFLPCDGKLKFADRLRALLKKESSISCNDDPFNSDDPYAFSDPISEQESSCIRFSATPILRTAWNTSQRIGTDLSYEQFLKHEQIPKNCSALDGKVKSNAPKLSKTMYRLHAKIAQNKILDKQKKTQDSSQSMVAITNSNFHPVSSIKVEPLSPSESTAVSNTSNDSGHSPDFVKTEILDTEQNSTDSGKSPNNCLINLSHTSSTCQDQSPKVNSCSSPVSVTHPDHSVSSSDSASDERTDFKFHTKCNLQSPDKAPYVLQRIHRIFGGKQEDRDIFPLGYESTESEKSDSEEESHLFSQISSFSSNNRRSPSSPQFRYSRHLMKIRLKAELQRSYQQLRRLHILRKQQAEQYQNLIQTLIDSSRLCPNQVAEILDEKSKTLPQKKNDYLLQAGQKCSFRKDNICCSDLALPYTCHCQKHIMDNCDQLLFQYCTAKYPDNTQCCVPVFDICNELPLCMEHAQKKDNYEKMTLEPKPKKPRKKPKPSALTRPPKRGKKKKKPNPLLRPTLSLPQLPSKPNSSLSSISNHVSCHLSFGNSALKPVETVLQTAEITRDLNGEIDSELGSDIEEQFSPGAIEKSLELPLDDTELANQATKLLEEHELTEVLNKIPDDAFNDLFVETRNGEYIPIPNEELERALAAVSKDVHLTNSSLAKLSSSTTTTELEELERLLGAENLTSAIDENAFPELNNSLNVITSSFSSSDLNSFTQALSNITNENIEQNQLPAVSDNHIISDSVATVPLLTSDVTHPNMLNGHTSVANLHPLHVDPNYSTNLLDNGISPGLQENSAENRLLSSNHLATILFGHSSTNAVPQTTFANGSNISDDAGLISTQGGLTTTHWLLNSSDQVLALSHMAYQNGFIVTSQNGNGNSAYTSSPLFASVAKYPLQTISAEVSLVSSNAPLVTSSCSENASCETMEQSVPSINHAGRPVSLQQNGSSKVIVQEGAS